MNRLLLATAAAVVALGWSAACPVRAADADRVRVSVTCQDDGRPAPEIQDLVSAAISANGNVETLERAQVDLLLAEGGLGALTQDADRRTRLGRLLALDYFLNLRRAGGEAQPWTVEVVNAQSGALVKTARVAPGNGAAVAAETAAMIRDGFLGASVQRIENPAGVRVAVLDFTPASSGSLEGTAAGLRLSAETRATLGQREGVLVLDRAWTQGVIREQVHLEEGLVVPPAERRPLLGADFVVLGRLTPAGVELSVLDPRAGRTRGVATFALTPRGALPEAAGEWLGRTLRPGDHGNPPPAPRTSEDAIQIEALEPFYRGVARFHAGRFLEATEDFQQAYILNDKFGDAMLGEARCYDALGLTPLANAERRFVKYELVGRGLSASGQARPEAGAVTFLGVASADGSGGGRAVDGRVEMLAVDLLSEPGAPRLQLARDLARFRDEYDVLVGVRETRGARWTEAPAFLTGASLRGELGAPDAAGTRRCVWLLADTLTGELIARTEGRLGADPAGWREALRSVLAGLRKSDPPTAPEAHPTAVPLPETATLEAQLSSRNGLSANVPLLALALRDPANPRLVGRGLAKGGDGYNLQLFLNFGLRDYLVERLPAASPARAWVELGQLGTFLPIDRNGQRISGREPDPYAALETFAAAHPDDLPGAVATYWLLYDHLGSIPPETLAGRLGALETRLARFNDRDLGGHRQILGMTRTLQTTAQIATGRFPDLNLPSNEDARRLALRFDREGQPRLEGISNWVTSEWHITPDGVTDPVQEARASLAILGRGSNRVRVRPEWMRDYPASTVLLVFTVEALHESNYDYGCPFLFEFDAAAERRHFRNVVAFAHRGLLDQLDRTISATELAFWERWVSQFVRFLTHFGYLETVPDAEWETLRGTLIKHMDAANARTGRRGWFEQERLALDWRKVPRRPSADPRRVRDLWNGPYQFFDREALLTLERQAGERSWRGSPVEDPGWSDAVHDSRLEETLTVGEMAEVYRPHFPRLQELFGASGDLGHREAMLLHDFGATLLAGGLLPEAEWVYTRILAAEDSDLNRFPSARELRANAAMALAWICRASGRKAEAFAHAQHALVISGNQPFRLLGRLNASRAGDRGEGDNYDYNNNGRAMALRLSTELRADPATARLPARVKAVVVRTPNLANAETTFYCRVPPDYDPAKTYPVLLLIPSLYEGVLDYCRDGNAWARFADEQGFFLLVPQFLDAMNWGTGAPTVADYQCAQVWSGQATLDALAVIGRDYRVDDHRLLLHGYGGGAWFAQRFALWAPERCAALSVHSAGRWAWFDWQPGLHPLASLKDIPCLATTGERDEARRDAAVQWVTMARGAGVSVDWRELPGVGHYPTPEMEELSRAFLARSALRGMTAKVNPASDPLPTLANRPATAVVPAR